jgi:outer membrane immunogenic protein
MEQLEFELGDKMRSIVKTLLLVSVAVVAVQSASAADLPARPVYKSPAVIVAYNWAGWYVGAFAGPTATRSRGIDPHGLLLGKFENTGVGITAGGTLGYNWNLGWTLLGNKVIAGLEGDFGYFGSSHRPGQDFNEALTYDTKTKWLATARGRIGLANGPNLTYFTGGYAAMSFTDLNKLLPAGNEVSSTRTKSGWTVGSGVETMLGAGWTAKSETMYINMGSGNALEQPASVLDTIVNQHRYFTQRFGVNYLLGGGTPGPLPQTNWNGFYAGVVAGGVVSSIQAKGTDGGGLPGDELGNNGTGFSAGAQAGWNWMIAPRVVVGVEGDFSWLGVDHTSFNYNNFNNGADAILGVDTSWFATARGRLAYNTGPALLYVTGGGAWVKVKNFFQGEVSAVTTSKTLSGWAAGGGIETTLWGNWSSKNEYLYVDVGDGDLLSSGTDSVTADHRFHMFRSALVYRFN